MPRRDSRQGDRGGVGRTPGTLYVCATPIGNLRDITLRALDILRGADRILAEDTRQTRKLLSAYGIPATLESFHEHNEARKTPRILEALAGGATCVLVVDAGTPGVADPGSRLVRAAHEQGIPVVTVPGPSAAVAALAASGLPGGRFLFLGFPPRRATERRAFFARVEGSPDTVVLFEAPHRLAATLAELAAACADRRLAVCRELTKVHEEIWLTKPEDALARYREEAPRGEFVLVLEGKAEGKTVATPGPARRTGSPRSPDPRSLQQEVLSCMQAGLSRRDAIRHVALARALPRRTVYRAALALSEDPPVDEFDERSRIGDR